MIVMFLRIAECTSAPSNFVKKLFPNPVSPLNGLSCCITKACPGTCRSFLSYACIMAVNLSVVGSGPILCPGKSFLRSERINEVFPTEYCPRITTIGLASKSLGPSGKIAHVAPSADKPQGQTFAASGLKSVMIGRSLRAARPRGEVTRKLCKIAVGSMVSPYRPGQYVADV